MYSQLKPDHGYPLRAVFVPFPFVAFTFALFTDILYWRTSMLMWQNFSAWLLFGGLVFGAIAVIAGLVDAFRSKATRPAIPETIGFAVVLVLGIFNSFVHAGDGWKAVVPNGLILSTITFVVILITLWLAAARPLAQEWRFNHD
ncbi:UNVERIFIED_ORG: putative membrane protein [Martelella mediterranea]